MPTFERNKNGCLFELINLFLTPQQFPLIIFGAGMKKLNKILIYLIIPLAIFACVEKGFYSFIAPSPYVIENTNGESESDNSGATGFDLTDFNVTLNSGIYSFNLNYLPSEKVIIPDLHYIQHLYFCIWQPPKIS